MMLDPVDTGFLFFIRHGDQYIDGLTRPDLHAIQEQITRELLNTDPVMDTRRNGLAAINEEK